MKKILSYAPLILILALFSANIFIWQGALAHREEVLKVYFLDVGQGDSIFIEGPNGNQVLIDGGVGSKVLSELGAILPIYDRHIDVLIETHPDQDHIGGFPDVLKNYDVSLYIEPGVVTDKGIDVAIDQLLKEKNIPKILARRGQTLDLGGGAELVILFPDRDVRNSETNEASIIAKLIFGDTSYLFTGDSPIKIENYLLSLNKEILDSDILKVGHHGSRTSTSKQFLEAVSPEIAVISAGKDNSYGHPHTEVTKNLQVEGILIRRTDEEGRILFESRLSQQLGEF